MDPSEVKPYGDGRGKTEQVREMFDNIAPAYDCLNRAMSFGLDKSWRRKAVGCVACAGAKNIVDIATGTGDFAINLAKNISRSNITGLDLSENMIEIGREKVAKAGLSNRIAFVRGDCIDSPLPAGKAEAVTVAFGIRNFEDIVAGYKAMFRMLKPGGLLCVLELSTPVNPFVRFFYNLYSRNIIPFMGRLISKDNRAYSYLPESIAAVPQGEEMLALMRQAGFVNPNFRRLTFGVCTLYTAITPNS